MLQIQAILTFFLSGLSDWIENLFRTLIINFTSEQPLLSMVHSMKQFMIKNSQCMHRLGHFKVTHVKFVPAGFKNSSNSLLNRTYRTEYFLENRNKYRNLKFGKFWHSKKSFYMKNPFNISEKYTHWKIVDYDNFYYLHFWKSLFFECTSKKISFGYIPVSSFS